MSDIGGEPRVAFFSSRAVRIGDTLLAAVFLAAGGLLALFLPLGLALLAADAGVPTAHLVGGYLAVVFLALRAVWRSVVYRLRFCLVFRPGHLEVGRGWTKCELPFDEIDEVLVPGPEDKGCWIKIRSGKRLVRVVLSPRDVDYCFRLLMQLCRSAVVVDAKGEELVPVEPDRPERVLHTLQNRATRMALVMVAVTLFMAASTVGVAYVVLQWRRGNIAVEGFDAVLVVGKAVILPAVTVVAAASAFSSHAKVRRLRRQRLVLAEESARDRWPAERPRVDGNGHRSETIG